MGTRSGNIDPAIMEFIAKKENLDIEGVMNVLNKKSGLLGLSGGLSSDFRDLNEAAEGVIGGPNAWDGYLAAITADALVRAQTSGKVETITPAKEKPAFYA